MHEAQFIEAVRTCGVSFAIWKDKQGNLDWTSLMGTDKKKLLNHLANHFAKYPARGCLWQGHKAVESKSVILLIKFVPMIITILRWVKHKCSWPLINSQKLRFEFWRWHLPHKWVILKFVSSFHCSKRSPTVSLQPLPPK